MSRSDFRRSAWLVLVPGALAAGDVVVNQWIGPSPGIWSDPTRWSAGVVPQNGGGTTFEVVVTEDAGGPSVVALDAPVNVDSLTIGPGARVTLAEGTWLTLSNGVLSNDGVLAIESGATPTELRIVASETSFDGRGAIELLGPKARIVRTTTATAHLVNGADHTIRGGGLIGLGALRLTNFGVIEASAGQQLELDFMLGRGGVIYQDNQGLLRAAEGGTLSIVRGVFLNVGGVIEAGPASTLRLGIGSAQQTESVSIGGGIIRDADGDGPGLLEVGGSVLLSSTEVVGAVRIIASAWPYAGLSLYSKVQVPSELTLEGNADGVVPAIFQLWDPVSVIAGSTILGTPGRYNRIQGPASPQNSCLIEPATTLLGSFEIAFGLGFENQGVIDIDPLGWLSIQGNHGCLNAETGVIRLSTPSWPSIKCNWHASVENRGVVEIGPERIVQMWPGRTYLQAAGVTHLDGRITHLEPAGEASLLMTGGVLIGSGECVGPVEHAGGVLDPGSCDGGAAVFTISGTLTQGGDAMLAVDLGAADPRRRDDGAFEGDRVAVSGAAAIAGTLRVRFAPGFMPRPGAAFTVLTASSVSGAFDAVDACAPVEVEVGPRSVTVTFAGASLADLDDDGFVDGSDLGALLGEWGRCADECCRADFDGDGIIDGADLGTLLGAWS